ncbi:Glycosyl transferase, group 1 [Modestobacter italicus]|uniref:Glycosyl transferase, group 1 n=1 Tax=Modestobacter italicus (strain DSM 44449 / CECT 9708 / BC 501) TaxID=2732864 RepID=I4ERC8_MODI5|nr:glycosyltransferase family 4 protein [Modestobacter marinus]CCH85941.1 Glycosyl transferase, group 1 [Modestobacter marinus]
MNRLGDKGDGISNVCVDLACQQSMEGDHVMVATNVGGFTDLVGDFGVDVVEVDFSSRSVAVLVRTTVRFRRLVREFTPCIVHAHTMVATVIARIAVAGTGTKVVATVHNEYQRGVILMAAAHRVVGVSSVVAESMRLRGLPRWKIRTVLNGTVGSVRRQARDAGLPIDLLQPALVAVGAVSHRKGADLLVEVALEVARSHGAHTYFAGNIDWDLPRRTAANSDVADHVHFLGFQPDPRRLLASATVFVLPSRRDPAPLVLVEAMEAGLPIVATAVDGVTELLAGGAAGLLVGPNDPAALIAAVRHLLDDPAARQELGDAALLRSTDLNVRRVSADYRMIYEELRRGRTCAP